MKPTIEELRLAHTYCPKCFIYLRYDKTLKKHTCANCGIQIEPKTIRQLNSKFRKFPYDYYGKPNLFDYENGVIIDSTYSKESNKSE